MQRHPIPYMGLAAHVLGYLDVIVAFQQVQHEIDEGTGLADARCQFLVLADVLVDQQRGNPANHVLIAIDIRLRELLKAVVRQHDMRQRRAENAPDLDVVVLFENVQRVEQFLLRHILKRGFNTQPIPIHKTCVLVDLHSRNDAQGQVINPRQAGDQGRRPGEPGGRLTDVRLVVHVEDCRQDALQALVVVGKVINFLPEGGSQALGHLTIVDDDGDQPSAATDPVDHRRVQLLPNPRLLNANLGQDDDDGPRLLQPFLEDFVHQTVARLHFPLVEPRIDAVLAQTPRELDDEAILVFAGVADEHLGGTHSPASKSALLNFSTL